MYRVRREEKRKKEGNTYTSVCADVHFQAIVLAERFVTVGALVRTFTYGTKAISVHETMSSP